MSLDDGLIPRPPVFKPNCYPSSSTSTPSLKLFVAVESFPAFKISPPKDVPPDS